MPVRERRNQDDRRLAQIIEAANDVDGYPPHWPGPAARFIAGPGELGSFVFEEHGEVRGHVAIYENTAHSVMNLAAEALGTPTGTLSAIARLFVDPAARRSGIGSALLHAATTFSHSAGRRPILDVWERLPPAIAFYDSAGWKRVGSTTIEFRSSCTDRCVHDGNSILSLVYVGPGLARGTRDG